MQVSSRLLASMRHRTRTDSASGDNVMPSIWSFIEICVATLCACLPALRTVLSRWFPSVFDIQTSNHVYRPDPFEHTGPNLNSQSSSHPPSRRHTEKIGPSYSKGIINDPDDEFLATLEEPAPTTESKVWINLRSAEEGSVLEQREISTNKSGDTSRTSIFLLQGPRLLDEDTNPALSQNGSQSIDERTIGIGIALSDLNPEPEPSPDSLAPGRQFN